MYWTIYHIVYLEVWDEPKLPGDSGQVLIDEWSGWLFKSCCEIFSLIDKKKKKIS